MRIRARYLWLAAGCVLGFVAAALFWGKEKQAYAANDRYEDYIMCTGTVMSTAPGRSRAPSPTDGVWLLDYRNGKLLGTVIDKLSGTIGGWAEVDLVAEFGLQPRQNVHFMMTTGSVSYNQAALYVAETTTGKFAVYTIGARTDGQVGIAIRRHDLVSFRPPPKQG